MSGFIGLPNLKSGLIGPTQGTILQIVYDTDNADQSHTSTSFTGNTSNLAISITPKSPTSDIIIHVSATGYAVTGAGYAYYDLYKNASDVTEIYNITGTSGGLSQIHAGWGVINFTYRDTCTENSTSTKTYKVSWRANSSGLVYFGWGANAVASMFAYEIAT